MFQVFDQGPGKVLFRGTREECEAYIAKLPSSDAIWCKIFRD